MSHPACGSTLREVERPWRERLTAARKSAIEAALLRHDGNLAHAADCLGVNRTYLYRMMGKVHIKLHVGRRAAR